MRITITTLAFAVIILSSCQKERDFANQSAAGNTTSDAGGLLVKMVQRTGTDSLVTTYGYDGSRRLITLTRLGVDDQGDPVNAQFHFHRNASGIITDYSSTGPALVAVGIDSIKTIVHYASSRYTSYVLNINTPGFVLLDSSVFVYDGAGRIIGENFYESPAGTGNDYYLAAKFDYSYDASSNFASLIFHQLDQSGAEVFTASTSNIKYDSEVNPIHTNNEAFVMGHPEWTSFNNIISEQGSDSNGPVDDQKITMSYTYNSARKPATNVTRIVPDNTTTNTSYYYQ